MRKTTEKNEAVLADFAARINLAWNKQVASIIEVGKLLINAQDEVDKGSWLSLFTERPLMHSGRVPFGERTAQSLMAIARHRVLSDPQYIAHLPPSWGTLSDLCSIPDEQLISLIEQGKINPEMHRADVAKLDIVQLRKFPGAIRIVNEMIERYETPEDLLAALEHEAAWRQYFGTDKGLRTLSNLAGFFNNLAKAHRRWAEENGRCDIFPGQIDPDRREEIEAARRSAAE